MGAVTGSNYDDMEVEGTPRVKETERPTTEVEDRTHSAVSNLFVSPPEKEGGSLSADRVTFSKPALSADLKAQLESKNPNPALAIILLGLEREKFGSARMKEKTAEVRGHLETVRILLKLNAKLITYPESKDSHELDEETLSLLDELKGRGAEVWKGDNKISKTQLDQLKSQISGLTHQEQTEAQNIFAVDIQGEINNLNSLNNILIHINSLNDRLNSKAINAVTRG